MAAAESEPWYRDGLRFQCTQCGNCCTGAPGVVWVNDDEIEEIARVLDKPVGEIRLMHTRPYPGGTSLTEFANGDCTFLDPETRGCKVYAARPRQCRTWPFWKSNLQSRKAWDEASRDCPGMDQGDLVQLELIESQAAVLEPEHAGYQPTTIDEVFCDDCQQYPTARLTGLFQADSGWVHQSKANRIAVGDADDGADFRRARLQAVGDVWDNVGYSVEFDFGFPGRPTFMDVWLEVRDLYESANLRIGQYRQPIFMDGLTSVKELTFIERALPFALIPFRQIGSMLHGTAADDAITWAFSVFRFPTGLYGGNLGDNGGYGMATRVTAVAIDNGDSLLIHLGSAFSHADPSNNALRYLSQPEFFLSEIGLAALAPAGVPSNMPPFVDTGAIAANHYNLFGWEFALRSDSLHVESELLIAMVDRPGAGTAVFPGAYVQAGYFLTGEVRPYDRAAGVMGEVTPRRPFSRRGGKGAWEVAARWSYIDLNDAGIRGGSLHDITLGLNWHLNKFVKLQCNYIHAMLDSPVNGDSNANILAFRAHLDF
eukprot:g33041.t1